MAFNQLDRIVEHFNCGELKIVYNLSRDPNLCLGMGVILNVVLIYLIRRFSRIELGSYKYLLAGFSAYDLYLSIVHAIVNPVSHLKALEVNVGNTENTARKIDFWNRGAFFHRECGINSKIILTISYLLSFSISSLSTMRVSRYRLLC